MRILTLLTILLFLFLNLGAQKIYESYVKLNDSLRIGNGKTELFPCKEKGYTLILPDKTTNISGVIISLEDEKFDLGVPAQQIYTQANAKGLAVLYISTGMPVDLYFSKKPLLYVDSLANAVFKKYDLPNKNIFFLGVNLSGFRALKYIQYCKQNKPVFNPDTKGIILCDGVLDWVRQWYEGKKGIKDKFAESSVFEGKLITYLLEKNLGGTPKNDLEKYLDFSAYSYFDEKNRHIKYFKDYAVRAYSEPATSYWQDIKRKTVFDTNFPDMVGIINELKLAGNTKAELIVFNQDKNNMDRRNPNYTWGLVDKKELVDWILLQIK